MFEQIITQSKTPTEIANEYGYTTRVVEKWAYEKFNLSNRTYKNLATITPRQRMLILAGTLGDGHIDKREKYPIYIEVHAENQKEYLFWKYELLKNLCMSKPTYKKPCKKIFNEKEYSVQGQYRFTTRAIQQLDEIRKMDRIDKIMELDEFGISLHILDDGYRGSSGWEICLAEWSEEEIDAYMSKLKSFGAEPRRLHDKRYVGISASTSKTIDMVILKNVPNNIDIIKNKIHMEVEKIG